jgi:biotin carboxylase
VNGTEAIRAYFASSRAPIYFLNTTSFNLLGADRWLGGLKFISAVDSFDGAHENAFTATLDETVAIGDVEGVTRALLDHPAVAAFVEPGAKALFLMFDESAEALARSLGLQVCLPSAVLCHQLDSKLTTTRLADRAGVRSAPNVIARIGSYDELRCIAHRLGEELVIQLPYSDSGSTTFFVSSEQDFATYAVRIAAEPEVKVMQRMHCRSLTIEGCVTRHGVLVGALQTELVGFSELTPLRGGWCGNEVFATGESCMLNQDVRQQAQRATQAIAVGPRISRVLWAGLLTRCGHIHALLG